MSIIHTFRINPKTNEILAEEAKREDLNLNAFVNKLLNRYANTYRFFQRPTWLSLSRRIFTYLLEELPEERATALGRKLGVEDPSEWARIFGREYGKETSSFFLEEALPAAGWFECEKVKGSIGAYFLHHRYGSKWTLFLCAFLEAMTATFYTRAKFEVTKEGLYCEIDTESKTQPNNGATTNGRHGQSLNTDRPARKVV